jgi:hypothetical protein
MLVETLQYNVKCQHSEQTRSTMPRHARKWICDNQNFAGDTDGMADVSFEARLS